MEVLEDHAVRNRQSDGKRGQEMAEGIDQRSRGAEYATLGLEDHRRKFNDSFRTNFFCTSPFFLKLLKKQTAQLCFAVFFYDNMTTRLSHRSRPQAAVSLTAFYDDSKDTTGEETFGLEPSGGTSMITGRCTG